MSVETTCEVDVIDCLYYIVHIVHSYSFLRCDQVATAATAAAATTTAANYRRWATVAHDDGHYMAQCGGNRYCVKTILGTRNMPRKLHARTHTPIRY